MKKISRNLFILISATLAGAVKAKADEAQCITREAVSVEHIDNLESWRIDESGNLEVTLKDGQILTFARDQYALVDDVYYISLEEVEAMGLTHGVWGIPPTMVSLGAGMLAGLGGAAITGGFGGGAAASVPDGQSLFPSGSSAFVEEGELTAYISEVVTENTASLVFRMTGPDANKFIIDSGTGRVSFREAPDYENPGDANGDNVYEIVIIAFDGVTTFEQPVSISVTNTNDNAPIFVSSGVGEIVEGDFTAYYSSAGDIDGDVLTYSIDGLDAEFFTIDAASGEVRFIESPDYENPLDGNGDNIYEITVTASDGIDSVSETVTITVTNSNDITPHFISPTEVTIDEGEPVAYDTIALDEDGDALTYSISGTDAELFDIDIISGQVRFKQTPDFENPTDFNADGVYEFIVSASDGVYAANQAVSVTVNNINDNVPLISGSNNALVPEDEVTAYVIDVSDGDGDTLTYSLSGDDAAHFEIDEVSGEVRFITAPDYENPQDADGDNVYEFVFTVSDGTNDVEENVTISVENINDSLPYFISATDATAEEGQLAAYDANAVDIDGNPITYSISGVDSGLFTIDPENGLVRFVNVPNFEIPGDANGDNIYEITIRAHDGVSSVSQDVTIRLSNDNDNVPVFESGSSSIVQEGDLVAYDAEASDADGDVIIYSLSGGDADSFSINSLSGLVTFLDAPDFENPGDSNADNVYHITVRASDGVVSTSADVTITVNDSNDNAPVFNSNGSVTVAENQTLAYRADVTDGDGDVLAFSISGEDASLFSLDNDSGQVTFLNAPDYEIPGDANGDNVYKFTITASDGNASTDQEVTVVITDANDNAPVFTSGSSANSVEGQLVAYNADAVDVNEDEITYSISGVDAAQFIINAETGVVTFRNAPDYEAPTDSDGDNSYEIFVTANDGTNFTDQSVTIEVENANDNAPIFTSSPNVTSSENQTSAFSANVTDADNDDVDYSISGGDAALFTIDAEEGVVNFINAPDFENPSDLDGDNVYEFTINAEDGQYTTSQAVRVTISNSNDSQPVFFSSSTVTESENENSAYNADARDEDGDTLIYTIGGTDGSLFNIDPLTGVVTFKNPPDFENPGDANNDNIYEFIVSASDGLNSTDHPVSLEITNANDDAPVFTSSQNSSLEEGQTLAYDADATDVEILTYSISGVDAAVFNIDTLTGVVTFQEITDYENPLDQDGNNVYDIIVTANDGANETSQEVEIEVTNLNDNGPIFTSESQVFAAENQISAYNATVVDVDGDPITYSISGEDSNLFRINTLSGVVTFRTAPDYENPSDANGDEAYNFTVTASDGENTVDHGVIVTVLNSNDNVPIFSSGSTALAAEEQTNAYNANASDDDGDDISYSMTGADAHLFNINPTTGVVTFISEPDFDNPADSNGDNAYVLTIRASDGENSTDQVVTVNVLDRIKIFLQDLDPTSGFIIQGDTGGDELGHSVSSAGDVNGDGFDDMIVGAAGGDDGGNNAGEAYVIFGGSGGFGSSDINGRQVVDVSNFTSVQGFVIRGDSAADQAGYSVSAAGDVNGDGLDDVIVGAIGGDDGGVSSGEAYVVFGSGSGFGSVDGSGRQVIDLSNMVASQGFIIQGDSPSDALGHSVSSAGDVNGDGFDDIVIGAPEGDDGGGSAGEAYIVFGSGSGFGNEDGSGRQVVDLTTLAASEGFIIKGDLAGDGAGRSVSSAGDFNGDGYDDMIIGSLSAADGLNAGEAYIIYGGGGTFGSNDGGRQVIDLTNLNPSQGFLIHGSAEGDEAGASVSLAGDLNGDGYDDIIIGAPRGNDGGAFSGEAYVVFGSQNGFGAIDSNGRLSLDVTDLNPAQGFVIQGDASADFAGNSVSSAGDINGDGYEDMIVGAYRSSDGGNNAGEAFIVYGNAYGFGSVGEDGRLVVDLTNLSSALGFIIQGDVAVDHLGDSVSAAGDIDGDGYDDLIVGAGSGDDGGTSAGEAYVIYGGPFADGEADRSLFGSFSNDILVGGGGDDTISGGGGADSIRGGAGDDQIEVGDLNFADIDGGRGQDSLALLDASQTLNLSVNSGLGLPAEIKSIEIIHLTGSGNNTLIIDSRAVFDTSDDVSNGVTTLTVRGNAGDRVTLAESGWAQGSNIVLSGVTYASFTRGNARLLVELGVNVNSSAFSSQESEERVSIDEIDTSDMDFFDDENNTNFGIEGGASGIEEGDPENSPDPLIGDIPDRLLEDVGGGNIDGIIDTLPDNILDVGGNDPVQPIESGGGEHAVFPSEIPLSQAAFEVPDSNVLQNLQQAQETGHAENGGLTAANPQSSNTQGHDMQVSEELVPIETIDIVDQTLANLPDDTGLQNLFQIGDNHGHDMQVSEELVPIETIDFIDLSSSSTTDLNGSALNISQIESLMAMFEKEKPFWSPHLVKDSLEPADWDYQDVPKGANLSPIETNLPMDDLGG